VHQQACKSHHTALCNAAAPNFDCPTEPRHQILTTHWASLRAAAWHLCVDAYIPEVMPPPWLHASQSSPKWKKLFPDNSRTSTQSFTPLTFSNAQSDGCPSEYTWRPLFNAAKFGWHPLLECYAITLPRRKTRWNLLGCPKLPNRSQPLLGRSSPYCENVWRRYCCLTCFFWLSIHALVAKI